MQLSLTSDFRRSRRWATQAMDHPQLWRLALGLLLIAVVYIGLNAAAFGLLVWREGFGGAQVEAQALAAADTPVHALALFATFMPMAIGPLLAVRLLHDRRGITLFGHAPRVIRDFLIAAGFTLTLYAGFTLLLLSLDPAGSVPNLAFGTWLILLPLTALGVGVQTLAEELVFRGYMQQQLAARFAWRVIWMAVPALCFGALHINPAATGFGMWYPVIVASLFGLVAADLTDRTASLGAAWGLHFANNMTAIALLATKGTITGLALRITAFEAHEVAHAPFLPLLDLVPMIIVWLVLRRILSR
jgi:membrane protease YdiL (CAAX protease family)